MGLKHARSSFSENCEFFPIVLSLALEILIICLKIAVYELRKR
jgi:hypothetical protein